MTNILVTEEYLSAGGYPSKEKMVEMVNNDLIPFMAANFSNSGERTAPVVSLEEVAGYDFLFAQEDGTKIGVWESYFLNPEAWKSHRLLRRSTKG